MCWCGGKNEKGHRRPVRLLGIPSQQCIIHVVPQGSRSRCIRAFIQLLARSNVTNASAGCYVLSSWMQLSRVSLASCVLGCCVRLQRTAHVRCCYDRTGLCREHSPNQVCVCPVERKSLTAEVRVGDLYPAVARFQLILLYTLSSPRSSLCVILTS